MCVEMTTTTTIPCVVIGAGAVGLACGRAMAMAGYETLILETGKVIGSGISSRNSEVIHAGIYYPAGSLKAILCVQGKQLMYPYLRERNINFHQCGKLIVSSTVAEVTKLHKLKQHAINNGVSDMKILTAADVTCLEPNITCIQGLLSPTTGILDSHTFMQNLLGDAESHGANCVLNCEVLHGKIKTDGHNPIALETSQGDIHADIVINAAGLYAIRVIERFEGFPSQYIPQAYFAKGNYFRLSDDVPKKPFRRLVYPMPEEGGLGIHATMDLDGNVRFGPDVQWMLAPNSGSSNRGSYQYRNGVVPTDYIVESQRAEVFYNAIRKYWPHLQDNSLVPDYSGIRPKLCLPSSLAALDDNCPSNVADKPRDLTDFLIEGPQTHGVKGLINLFGIESPGLTASMAIAQHVLHLIKDSP